jgi:hypothetical protein
MITFTESNAYLTVVLKLFDTPRHLSFYIMA